MKFRYSIVTRFALFFTGLIIFSILLAGYLVFQKASKVIIENSEDRIMHSSELAEQSFYAVLNEVSNDIAVITASPILQNYVDDPTGKFVRDIDQLFFAMLKNKPSYFQLRLIGIDDGGREIIRFDKNDGNVFKSDTLQQKGDLDYFKQTIRLDKGKFYFSKINLNEEYGLISHPLTPTLRAASPIFYSDGRPMGILVINVDLGKLYNTFDQISRSGSELYLIDVKGQYVYNPDSSKQFAEQTKLGYNFYTDFRAQQDTVTANKMFFGQLKGIRDNDYLSYIKELTYFHGERPMYLISIIEQHMLLQSARSVREDSTQTLLWVCLFSIVMSWLFTSFFSKEINRITRAIGNYDKGITDHVDLPTHRNDEIGTLAKTFTKMKAKIDQHVKQLNSALKKEQHAKKQRDEFLQNMSHEMRTPLHTILGLTQLLYKQSPSEMQLPIINSLERSANNLEGLIYDVLDHQKLLERKVQIVHRPTNIAQLLRDIHSGYEFEALQKGLAFHLDLDKQLDTYHFETDPLRLSQMVTNLVVNGIKYTQEGEIELIAEVIAGDPPMLVVEVKDTGIGVLPENLAKINERFFREEEDLSGRYGGYGLGLSIVKQLTELFGGSLKAISEKGSGSQFRVAIPLKTTHVSKIRHEEQDRTYFLPRLNHQYQLLYIEDDPATVQLMEHVFDDEMIAVKHTDKWEHALQNIREISPDLIISDLILEDKNLVSLLSELVKKGEITCPLVLVSALEPEVMAQLSAFYFQKPFDLQQLKDCVYRFLGAKEYNAPDFSSIYSNYDGYPAKISQVLKLLHEEFETYLNRIELVIETKDQKEWKAILHKIVAHINNLGLTELHEILPQDVSALKSTHLPKIHSIFAYYLCCFRFEECLNSTDRFF